MELKRNARRWGKRLSDTVEFWFRRKYGLTPRDPRFLELTVEEVLIDYWAHRHADDPELAKEEVNDDFDADMLAWEGEEGVPHEALGPDDPGDFETVADDSWEL